jgi:hypothetical protein
MKKQSNSNLARLAALQAAIGEFSDPPAISAMRARAAEIEARLAKIHEAIAANTAAQTAPTRDSDVDGYISGAGRDLRAERDALAGERSLATDALRVLQARIDSALATARCEWAASRDVREPVAAQREILVGAAVTLFDALRVAAQLSGAAQSAGVWLAGPLWPGHSPAAQSAVGALIVGLAEAGAPVHPSVLHDARVAAGMAAG